MKNSEYKSYDELPLFLVHSLLPPLVCRSTHWMNFSLCTTIRLPIFSTGKSFNRTELMKYSSSINWFPRRRRRYCSCSLGTYSASEEDWKENEEDVERLDKRYRVSYFPFEDILKSDQLYEKFGVEPRRVPMNNVLSGTFCPASVFENPNCRRNL